MKEDKSILRTIKELKVLLRSLSYDVLKAFGIVRVLYPNIKQPYKRWYEKER